jgi:hypothetical protein
MHIWLLLEVISEMTKRMEMVRMSIVGTGGLASTNSVMIGWKKVKILSFLGCGNKSNVDQNNMNQRQEYINK